MNVSYCRGVLPLTASADQCSYAGLAFLRSAVGKRRYLLHRETSVSSMVRARRYSLKAAIARFESASLASSISPLRSRNSQAICLASTSSCELASSLNHVDIVVPRSLAEELLGSGLVPKFRRCGKICSREWHGRQRLSGTKPDLRSGPVFHPLGRCAAPILVDFCQR